MSAPLLTPAYDPAKPSASGKSAKRFHSDDVAVVSISRDYNTRPSQSQVIISRFCFFSVRPARRARSRYAAASPRRCSIAASPFASKATHFFHDVIRKQNPAALHHLPLNNPVSPCFKKRSRSDGSMCNNRPSDRLLQLVAYGRADPPSLKIRMHIQAIKISGSVNIAESNERPLANRDNAVVLPERTPPFPPIRRPCRPNFHLLRRIIPSIHPTNRIAKQFGQFPRVSRPIFPNRPIPSVGAFLHRSPG